jgi:hypothetical protein
MPQILKRIFLCALTTCAVVSVSASSAAARTQNGFMPQRGEVTHAQDSLCSAAHIVRKKVIDQFGKRAPGRDICRYGFSPGVKATKNQEKTYLETLQRMIAPPPVAVQYAASGFSPAPQSSAYSAGVSSAVPGCASESGTNYSTGPSNTNPSSGATGRYQIIPSTHASLCPDLGWSPSAQDQCAARIYKAQGSSAWVGCGG